MRKKSKKTLHITNTAYRSGVFSRSLPVSDWNGISYSYVSSVTENMSIWKDIDSCWCKMSRWTTEYLCCTRRM